MRKVGERCAFSGGAEHTPIVRVVRFQEPRSLHNGDKSLAIIQNGQTVLVSPETMKAILDWYNMI
jgi:hypothetical protein